MPHPSSPLTQRDLLVETGARIFHERGYAATGVRQVAAAAGVPLGSFTNHFRSKERFGLSVLERYVAQLDGIFAETLRNETLSPMARIDAYFDVIEAGLEEKRWSVGCLIPDLASETAASGEEIRSALAEILDRQTVAFAAVLTPLLGPDQAEDVAGMLLAAWHGTLLRMKAERSPEPVARFRRTLFLLCRPQAA